MSRDFKAKIDINCCSFPHRLTRRMACKEQESPRGRIRKNATKRERMARRLSTKKGRETYRLRGRTIEPVFGQIKKNF